MASLSELGSIGKFLGRAATGGLIVGALLESGCEPSKSVPTPVQSAAERGKPTPPSSPTEVKQINNTDK